MNRYAAPVIFALGFLIRVWLIHAHPIIFGGDTILRLANRDRILLAYQLPLLQAAIYGVSQISDGLLPIRYLMALIGALAGLAFYWLATDFLELTSAFWAALLFVSSPFLLQLSIVPYQEVLMVAGLSFAFHFFFNRKWFAASLSLGLACLTRYEAWVACPVLVLAYAWNHQRRPLEVLKGALLFGWAPLAWVLYNRALSASGTFVVEMPASPYRLMRYVYLGWITVKNTPLPVLFLAAIGATQLWKRDVFRDTRIWILSGFLALFLLAILFSAHGESPDPERFVTAREATLWIAGLIFLAGFALGHRSRTVLALAAAGFALGIYNAHQFIVRDTSRPHIQLSYQLANYLDANLKDEETAVILTKPLQQELAQAYVDKAFRRGGERALRRAQEVLASMDTSPPDYQRTMIHSRLGSKQLLSIAGPAIRVAGASNEPHRVDWVAVWSDFSPTNTVEARLYERVSKDGKPVTVLTSRPGSVAIYRLSPP